MCKITGFLVRKTLDSNLRRISTYQVTEVEDKSLEYTRIANIY